MYDIKTTRLGSPMLSRCLRQRENAAARVLRYLYTPVVLLKYLAQ